jgi:uncharacterized protein YggE
MRIISIILTLFVISVTVKAQDVINIHASAEVLVPADKIAFQINLNAESDTPQAAYKLHKKRENVLVQLLKEHGLAEKNINFDPISISRVTDNRYNESSKKFVQTRQRVALTLAEFSLYEDIQLTLIENDFDEFSGNFISSELEKGENEALKKALKIAHDKASIIATETGLTISGIKNIDYSYNQSGPQPMMEMAARTSSANLMEFDQTVNVSATVTVMYKFEK